MHEEIKEMLERRSEIAKRVRHIRRELDNKFAKMYLDVTIVPMKPTVENFLSRIDHLMDVANAESIPSLSEYYTRCGWEDGMYESRQDARREAERLLTIVETM